MKSFWWFEDNLIAGMARPGLNRVYWPELSFDEAVLLGWLGQHSSGVVPRPDLAAHVTSYSPRVLKFYSTDTSLPAQVARTLADSDALHRILNQLQARYRLLEHFEIHNDHLTLAFSQSQLTEELTHLKAQDIRTIVSLTESHHHADVLGSHFEIHHLPIDDLGAPTREQVATLADLMSRARGDRRRIAVHCLAGLGRTSIMLMAASLRLGAKLEDLKCEIARRNPHFVLTGAQADFIYSIAQSSG